LGHFILFDAVRNIYIFSHNGDRNMRLLFADTDVKFLAFLNPRVSHTTDFLPH